MHGYRDDPETPEYYNRYEQLTAAMTLSDRDS